jgi:hypothetical protein
MAGWLGFGYAALAGGTMIMEFHMTLPVEAASPEKAGAPEQIEITPEMIEAGRSALADDLELLFDVGGADVERETVTAIYRAMAARHQPAGR